MIRKLTLPFFSILLVLVSFSLYTFGASLTLTKIGSLDLGGKKYTEWWYTGVSPAFVGTANVDGDVTIKLGDDTYKAKADSSGNWTYYSGLSAGDYNVVISQGSENYSFKLHLGSALPANLGGTSQTTQSTTAVPITGTNQLVALTLGLGITLLAGYFYISSDTTKKLSFEKHIIKEE